MREDTFRRKKASRLFKDIGGRGWLAGRMAEILCQGKQGLDGLSLELGGMVAEAIMYMEREEMAGPDYHPYCSQIQKWASQRGSIFVGDRKLGVEHPRLRGPDGEVVLRTYGKLKERNGFSEELLGKVLRGLSGRSGKKKAGDRSDDRTRDGDAGERSHRHPAGCRARMRKLLGE